MADKLERLLTLSAALLWAERPLSAEEIRSRVGGYPTGTQAFRRAFERDKDDLREMGIPLRTEPIPFSDPAIDGYVIRRSEYYLDDPGLEPDELAALHLAASVVQLEGIAGIGAFWKLGGVPDDDAPGADVRVALSSTPHLVAVYQAFAERRSLHFTYRDVERRVDPYRLDSLRGRWYLTGFDHSRGEERNFRVDRIVGTVELGRPGTFVRPQTAVPGQVLQPWELGEGEPTVARVRIDGDQAPSAVHHVGADAVRERHDDGSVVLELEVTNTDAFRSFVITFLEHAEVLSPPQLRDDLVAWLSALAGGPAR
jgi:proteasome accessory factor B